MSFFGKLFDFNHDGEVSSSEAMMGLSGAALIAGFAEEEEKAQREQELRDRLDTLVDEINAHSDESGFRVELEASLEDADRETLEEVLDSFQALLDELEDQEPDDTSSDAYDSWEEKHEDLLAKIDEVEELLDEMDD